MFIARLTAFTLGFVFAWAVVAKSLDPRGWRGAIAGYKVAPRLELPVTVLVPLVEAGLATLFFIGRTRIAAAASLAMLVLFSLAIVRAQAKQGNRLPCGCFGSNKRRDFRLLLARNTVLATGAGALLVYGRDVPGYPSPPPDGAWLPAALVVLGVALVLWLVVSVRSGMRRDVV